MNVLLLYLTISVVKVLPDNPVSLDMSELPKALYIISIETGNKAIKRQVLKE
jgi:hypothetical protein